MHFPNALVAHLDAETVGHALIGTGAYPKNGIILGNGYFKINQWKNNQRQNLYDKDKPKLTRVNY